MKACGLSFALDNKPSIPSLPNSLLEMCGCRRVFLKDAVVYKAIVLQHYPKTELVNVFLESIIDTINYILIL